MKIKKISVRKLFGVFDHDIPINKKGGITIIIGENGLGKTIVLEMVEALFTGKYFYFNSIAFEKLILEFTDGVKWELNKEEQKDDFPIISLKQINKNGSSYKPYRLLNYQPDDLISLARRISRHIPHIRMVGPRMWEDRRTGEIFHADELVYRFGDYLPFGVRLDDKEKPKWFTDKHDQINVSLIETQRLISLQDREEKSHEKTVEKYSSQLSRIIKSSLTESTELSSKLDRTYPNRLIERLKTSSNVSDKVLNTELARLEKKRETLDAVGLIEIEKDSNLLEIENPQEVIKDVLMLYVEDSFKKIEIFDTIARKIGLLLEIINKRFKHKRFYVEKESGFVFRSTIIKDAHGEFQKIPVTKLSSGEQNELVLFYELLFKSSPNSFILIDEPEVSLHISWQNCFIEDLKEIAELNNLEVLIATHSPDIIANNWDLKVELKGLE
ncbi:AAA family ATPase [Nonlabens xiamenensis]|uniref:AAA family ATPase n=1 Tax=Nonlabens xiamenensis TaxID=2341043 RepID=UPI000F612FB7|nr:AAA family ATPase [Nonlabens xiamenensis]